MKISDLLGEGWESDERTDPEADPGAFASPPTGASAPPAPPIPAPTEPVETRSPDVIPSLASWAPAPEPPAPEARIPAGERAEQLADLAAGLAVAPPARAEPEPEPEETVDELAGLHAVVDDLLPAAATRRKGSSRGSSRSGSRRRGR